MQSARILSVQVGMPCTMVYQGNEDDEGRSWESGIFKSPVDGPVWAGSLNLAGDGQSDLVHHGGSDRPVLIFGSENYPTWESELGKSLEPGAFGENLTVDSLTEDKVCIGDLWETDRVRLEVSQPRIPCFKLGRRLGNPRIVASVMSAMAGGWYCRVMTEGYVQAGQTLKLVARPNPEWTIRRAFKAYVFQRKEHEVLSRLIQLPQLSELWLKGIGQVLNAGERTHSE